MEHQVPVSHRHAAALDAEGKLADAEAVLRQILGEHPSDAQAHHNLGSLLARQRRLADAVASFAAAITCDPSYLLARKHLGRALVELGRHTEALPHLYQIVAAEPGDAEALIDLAAGVLKAGRPAEAVVLLRQVSRLRPNSVDVHNSLGLACLAAGQLAAAEAAFEEALRLSPGFASAHINLATAYKEQGRPLEALGCYDHGLRLDPASASSHWNRALVLLQMGDMARGWPEFEWRWKREASPPKSFREPLWDGADLAGRTILLHPEQGLGDTIQFIRYAPLMKQRGAGRVVFQCQAPLAGLLAGAAGVDELVVEGSTLPRFDVHLPLMSAPHRLGTTLEDIPDQVPYVSVPPSCVERWRQAMAAGEGGGARGGERQFRVGIAWQGNPHHQLDRFRSVPLSHFRPLVGVPGARRGPGLGRAEGAGMGRVAGIEFISLQRGPGAEQLDTRANRALGVRELTGRAVSTSQDWVDTAAIMKSLDLVMSVDTATAHLAGALGVPTWVALSATPDWRWMLEREDSPWYPTLRLFRQDELGKWGPVFTRMAAELERLGWSTYG